MKCIIFNWKEEKKNFFYILFLSIISVVLDLFGISLVIPLLALVSTDGIDSFFAILPIVKNFLQNYSKTDIFIFTAILIVSYFFLKALFNLYFTWKKEVFCKI